jgi:O-antigen/teichoic acid export membrane protein
MYMRWQKIIRGKKREIYAVFLGQGLTAVGAFFGIRLMTEYLSPQVFGQYKLLLSLISLLTGLLARPFLQYIMRAYHDSSVEEERLDFTNAARSILVKYLAVLGLVFSVVFTLWGSSGRITIIDVLLISILFVVQALLEFERSCAITRNEQIAAGIMGASRSWLVPVGIVISSFYMESITFLLVANTLVLTLLYGYTLFWLSKNQRQITGIEAPVERARLEISAAVKFGWPLVIVGLLGWIVHESDRFFLNYFLSDHAVGIYSAAYGLVASPFTIVVGMAAQLFYPIVFKAAGESDRVKEQFILRSMLALSSAFCAIGVVFIWIFGPQIAQLALGVEYREEALGLFVWLAAGYGLLGVAMSFDLAAFGENKTKRIMFSYLLSALINVSLNFYLIPLYGAKGAAVATMFALLSYLAAMAYFHGKPQFINSRP